MTLRALCVALCLLLCFSAPAWAAETLGARFQHLLALTKQNDPVTVSGALAEAFELAPLLKDGRRQLSERLTQLEKSPLPYLQGEVARLRARLQLEQGQVPLELKERAGVLSPALVLAPFTGPGLGAQLSHQGRVHASQQSARGLPWREVDGAALAGDYLFEDLSGGHGDEHAFIAVGLEVSAATEATLVLGSNGALSAWWNTQELFSWDGERTLGDWQHAHTLKLSPGYHELVVRVGERTNSPSLSLRLVDGQGRLPKGVRVRVPDGSRALAAFSNTTKQGLLTQASSPLAKLRWDTFVRQSERRNAEIEPSLEALKLKGEAKADGAYLLGRAFKADLSRSDEAFELANTLAKGHAMALGEQLRLTHRLSLEARADAIARTLEALEPTHPFLAQHRASRLLAFSDSRLALLALPEAGDAQLLSLRASLIAKTSSEAQAAAAYRALALQTHLNAQHVNSAVQAYRRAGLYDDALALLRHARTLRPYASILTVMEARTRAALPQPEIAQALTLLEEARAFHAADAELEEARGRIYLLASERGKAIEAFDRALELSPQERALADYRRSLIEERGLSERHAASVEELIQRRETFEREKRVPTRGATSLFERIFTQVFANGMASEFKQIAIYIHDPRLAEGYQRMRLAYTPGEDRLEILEAEVIRADGRRLRPEHIGDSQTQGKEGGIYTLTSFKTVIFPALEPGDLVHMQVRKDEIGKRNLFGDFFGVVWPFSSSIDKVFVEAIVEAPKSRPLYYAVQHLPEPERSETEDRQRLTFRTTNQPALVIEDSMPGYGDIGSWASISTFSDWNALIRWYRELIASQLLVPAQLGDEMRALAGQISQGLEGAARTRAIVAAVHGWVVQKTRYVGIEFGIHGFKPYSISEVVQRGYGDCKDKAALLVALLREVSIPAEFVLIRTRDYGRLEGTPATLWAFNHAIAYIPELDVYLDATAESAGLDELPFLDQGGMALRFSPWEQSAPKLVQVPMQGPDKNRYQTQDVIAIAADGKAVVRFNESIAGSFAGLLRTTYQDESRRQRDLSAFIMDGHPGAKLRELSYKNFDVLGAPIQISGVIEDDSLVTRQGDVLEVKLSRRAEDKFKDLASFTERRQPLIIRDTHSVDNTYRYELPRGSELLALPSPVDLESPFGHFKASYTHEGDQVVERISFAVHRELIATKDYPAFRNFLREAAQAEAKVLRVRLASKALQ